MESSESTTTISTTHVDLLASQEKDQDSKDNSHLSWLLTLPIGLADVEERAEKENKENKSMPTPKKGRTNFTGDGVHSPHCPYEADKTVPVRATIDLADDDVFADHS